MSHPFELALPDEEEVVMPRPPVIVRQARRIRRGGGINPPPPPPPDTAGESFTFPIYFDPNYFFPAVELSDGELAAFTLQARQVATPYVFLASSPNIAAWTAACAALAAEQESGTLEGMYVYGSMEVPGNTIIQYDDDYSLNAASKQGTMNGWSINGNVQTEFARYIANNGSSALTIPVQQNGLVPAVSNGSGGWTSNTNATMIDFKTVYEDFYREANRVACDVYRATKSTQYLGLGVTMVEGTTRAPTGYLHLSSPIVGIDWITADATYYRTQTAQFTSQSGSLDCLQSMGRAHDNAPAQDPWGPAMYMLVPMDRDELTRSWSLGDQNAVHRKLGNTIVDSTGSPPAIDFDPQFWLYWNKSMMRRYLSDASAAYVTAKGSNAYRFGGPRVKVMPWIQLSPTPAELMHTDPGSLGTATKHISGIYDAVPGTRADLYAAMFDTETAMAGQPTHVNPDGFIVFDSADYYGLTYAYSNPAAPPSGITSFQVYNARWGWEKTLGIRAIVESDELVGDTDMTALAAYLASHTLAESFYTGSHKWWTVAGGDQTGTGNFDPAALNATGWWSFNLNADIGKTEMKHQKALFYARRNLYELQQLRAGITARIGV